MYTICSDYYYYGYDYTISRGTYPAYCTRSSVYMQQNNVQAQAREKEREVI